MVERRLNSEDWRFESSPGWLALRGMSINNIRRMGSNSTSLFLFFLYFIGGNDEETMHLFNHDCIAVMRMQYNTI